MLGVTIAAPLWRKQYTTFGDLFRERYSPGVERLAVILMVPTSVLWAAAQIRAFGQVVSAASDLEVSIAITAAAGFVIIYTVAGGLLADVVTDFIQGIAVIVGLVVLLIAIGNAYGGVDELVAMIDTERLALFSTADATPLEIIEAWAVPVCGSLLAVEMLSRILGCKTAAVARNATFVGAALYVVIGSIPVVIGLVGPEARAGARRARAARDRARREAPVDLRLRHVRRRADLRDPVDRRQLPACGGVARVPQHHRAARTGL